jgi:hypothetical protein
MLDIDKITQIYFIRDEFSKELDEIIVPHSLKKKDAPK